MSGLAVVSAFAFLAGLGAVARWGASRWNDATAGYPLPWGTIGVNVAASFLLGVVHNVDVPWAWLIGAAFCGSLSTFSTFVLEVVQLDERYGRRRALACIAISIGAGLAAAWIGLQLTN